MPLLDRVVVVGAKVESPAGTAATLANSDSNFRCYNWRLERDIQMDQRPGGTGFSNETAVHGPRMGRATFETDLVGSGTDGTPPFEFSVLAIACALSLSTDVLTCATSGSALTIAAYKNGIREGIAGAMGTFRIVFNAGRYARIFWTFTGKLLADSDVAILSPTYPSVIPPRFASDAVSVHSVTPLISTAEFDLGNEVIMRYDPSDATGYIAAHVVDRQPTLTLDPEAVTIATKDWASILQAHTEGSVSIAIGSAAGNTFTLTSSNAQVVEAPTDARDKLVTRALKLQLNSSSPVTITQS